MRLQPCSSGHDTRVLRAVRPRVAELMHVRNLAAYTARDSALPAFPLCKGWQWVQDACHASTCSKILCQDISPARLMHGW